jgi:broad specificity phosphatase PhoE
MIKILGIDIINYTKFRIDNASVSMIDFPEDILEKPVVVSLNDTSHLKEA